MKIPKGGVAFFDSGIGGLTVLYEAEKLLPDEIFYYYGDNKHAPYGNRPPEQIRRYVLRAFEKFARLQVKAAVVACNTVTALCVEELRARYDFPIIGAEPAIFPASRKGGEVLVLTTRATYNSNRFRVLCERAERTFPGTRVRAAPCDVLAGMIEKQIGEKNFDYTPLLPKGKPTAVVLGCTHYIYIKEIIRAFYGCEVYDGNAGMANRLYCILEKISKEKVSKIPLDWDFRPLHEKNREEKPFLTTEKSERNGMNVVIAQKSQKSPKKVEKGEKKTLFFLGSGKKANKNIHEQMFAHT